MRTGTGRRIAVLLMLMTVALLGLHMASASAANEGQVCDGLSSGKVDVSGSHTTVTVTAPDGFLIDEYCVKAGSINQGLGPVYVQVDPPQASVTFGYPDGKDISHWSVHWIPVETTTTTSGPSTTTSSPSSTSSTTATTAPPSSTTSTPSTTTTVSSPSTTSPEETTTPTTVFLGTASRLARPTAGISELPFTGGHAWDLALLGMLVLVAGVVMVSARKRPRWW